MGSNTKRLADDYQAWPKMSLGCGVCLTTYSQMRAARWLEISGLVWKGKRLGMKSGSVWKCHRELKFSEQMTEA
jgi:hypothetical protein